jgi:hypothetical protein
MEKLTTKQITCFDEFIISWNDFIFLQTISKPSIECCIKVNLLKKMLSEAEFEMNDDQIDTVRICKQSLCKPKSIQHRSTSNDVYWYRFQAEF